MRDAALAVQSTARLAAAAIGQALACSPLVSSPGSSRLAGATVGDGSRGEVALFAAAAVLLAAWVAFERRATHPLVAAFVASAVVMVGALASAPAREIA